MTSFLLNWKEGILFASLIIFLFTPWSSSLSRYILLGLFIYLLNNPLVANFHPSDIGWWLGDPAAWITLATWLGGLVFFVRWLQGVKGQGVWIALSKISWSPHLIAISLIPLALFFFNFPVIFPSFKTQPDYSFALLLSTVPLQYFIGSSLLRFHDGSIRSLLSRSLGGIVLCVLLISLLHIPGTISAYRALLKIPPTQEGATELIKGWEALLERNRVASIASIRLTAYRRLGDLRLCLGDLEGAQQNYKKALRKVPDDYIDLVRRAQQGDNKALRKVPNDYIDLIRLARIFIIEGRTGEAREVFHWAIERNPSLSWEVLGNFFPPFQFNEIFILAEVLEAEGKHKDAFGAYSQALRMNPYNPMVNCRLGRIYFDQGDYEKAAMAFKKTLAIVPRHLCALSYLVDIYKDKGRADLARQYRDVAREVVDLYILPSDWKGKAGGNLYWKGGCYAFIKLQQGKVLFKVHARGTPAQGVWPHMVVKLNDEILGEVSVTTRSWKSYCFTKDVENGFYRLWIYFTNDRCLLKTVGGKKVREDRNLFVGDAAITYLR
jgi:tetratricopeptide (TPR) repeat protein